jgi:GT2 family glycosyltransferase
VKKNPLVVIATPVFNRKEHTRKFLQSLKKQSYSNFKTIIIDDGSSDGTEEMIKKEFQEVIVLKGDGNLWWSGGTNMGVIYAQKVGADYVLTINDDVEVRDDYIQSLVDVASEHPKSLIGSKVCYLGDRGQVWFFGAIFGKSGDMQHFTGRDEDFREVKKSEWLTGMGVLIPIEAFNDAGLYDAKNYPQYFGDAEFSVRAARAGYALLVSPDSKVYADVDASWVLNNIKNPKPAFIYQVFTSIRSPYQFKLRHNFYKEYWPGNYRFALARLYFFTLLGLYKSFTFASIKKIIGINRFRDLIPGKK